MHCEVYPLIFPLFLTSDTKKGRPGLFPLKSYENFRHSSTNRNRQWNKEKADENKGWSGFVV